MGAAGLCGVLAGESVSADSLLYESVESGLVVQPHAAHRHSQVQANAEPLQRCADGAVVGEVVGTEEAAGVQTGRAEQGRAGQSRAAAREEASAAGTQDALSQSTVSGPSLLHEVELLLSAFACLLGG